MTETPLHLAASTGNPAAVREALNLKPDVNARTEPNGFTPLHMGISGTDSPERQEIVRLLHAAGADLELKTYDKGLTPLQLAAMRNKPLCVEALLKCGANVRATEGNGATALHGAAFHGYAEVANLLLQAGANAKCADKHGNTPLTLAQGRGHARVYEALLASCGDNVAADERLLASAYAGNLGVVRKILGAGANPNMRRQDGATPLMLASEEGHTEVVRALLEHGADANAARTDIGARALLFASQNGHLEIAKLLLQRGADVKAKANDGKTALMAASLDGHVEIARLLIEKGAVVNETKEDGFTPLMLAALDGHVEVVRLLLIHGANAWATITRQGKEYTPLMLAANKGHTVVAKILRDAVASEGTAAHSTGSTPKKSVSATFVFPRSLSILELPAYQGRPISYKGAVVGRADIIELKTNGSVVITVKDIDETLTGKTLGADFVLRD